jgi:sulfite reductase (ferredoxin)
MNPSSPTLWPRIPEAARQEIDVFETELRRYLDGKMPEKVFLEFRLRHGVYGQRQPDIQMQRIKIPMGCLTAEQLECLAETAEEYSDAILHVTTRQDIQLHFVSILDTPNLFRRLASVGITTREACGNTVRNVTACPYSGVCTDEVFDVTPHARAMAYFLLRHPDSQNFGRKFKIAFSGCAQHHCGLARMHDIGAVARERTVDGKTVQGFEVYVGGGLGAVPHQAQLFDEFWPADRMLHLGQAISRVFARMGEKKMRARARMKFLVANLGIAEFRRTVIEELEKLPEDPQRDAMWRDAFQREERPLKPPSTLDLGRKDLGAAFRVWHAANVRPQKQPGYSVATVFLPLGDITSDQLRGLARAVRKYIDDTIRTTVPQNLILRWVSDADLPALHADLVALKLAMPLADTIADITACPGTDSCKLGIASSRGLAGVLHREYLKDAQRGAGMSDGTGALRRDVKIKISGCFNSCGQHHIANIGFFGTSKRKGNRVAPIFQVILGGNTENNADAYGLMVAKVPAHRAPDVVRTLTALYDREKAAGEGFNRCMARLGKARVNEELKPLEEIGDGDEFYHDNRQPWNYIKEVGTGECAGEVVDQAEFLLEDAERLVFDGSLHLEAGRIQETAKTSYSAMVAAANGLLSTKGLLLSDKFDPLLEFQKHFAEPGKFFPGCAEYFAKAAAEGQRQVSAERARQRLEEANLFVEEAHVVYSRMAGSVAK